MRLVVARIGRAHGIRGEVTSRCAPTPRRSGSCPAPACSSYPPKAARPPAARRRSRSRRCVTTTGPCCSPSTQVHDRDGAEALRGVLLEADVPDDDGRARRLVRPPARRPARPSTRPARRSARSSPSSTRPRRTCSSSAARTARRGSCRSSPRIVPTVDVAAGVVVVDAPRGLLDDLDAADAAPTGLSRCASTSSRSSPSTSRRSGSRSSARPRQPGMLDVAVHDLRDFTHDRHRTVDDTPAGGGAGHGHAARALGRGARPRAGRPGRAALGGAERRGRPARRPERRPGERFTQPLARELAGGGPGWPSPAAATRASTSGCWRTPPTRCRVRPVSLGDYVLNGGEVAVLAIVEAVARLLPGVVGNAESLVEESHEDGLLEYPVYTRPAPWRGRDVPAVLLSGHHGADRALAARRAAAPHGPAPPRPARRARLRRARRRDLAVLAEPARAGRCRAAQRPDFWPRTAAVAD